MNNRLYDPIVGRMLAVDNFVANSESTQAFNRYSYAMNNPLKYVDPSGEWAHIAVGAVIGGLVNWAMNGAQFNLQGLGYFMVGAASGAISAATGGAVAGALGTIGFLPGAAVGSSTMLAGNFVSGYGNTLVGGGTNREGFKNGLRSGAQGAIIGGITGGILGSTRAVKNGRNFFTGGEKATTYRSPIKNNFGKQNGECVLRCFEEFSESYGVDNLDYQFWLNENGNKLGVSTKNVESLVNNTLVFSSERISADINSITDAISNDKRILMGFNTNRGGAHAVMVRKAKVWPSGKYRIWFSETSPVRLAPHSINNIFELGGAGFWTFF